MTHEVDAPYPKGDEFGYFTFGGYDIIILFEAGADHYSLYGTELATVTPRSA